MLTRTPAHHSSADDKKIHVRVVVYLDIREILLVFQMFYISWICQKGLVFLWQVGLCSHISDLIISPVWFVTKLVLLFVFILYLLSKPLSSYLSVNRILPFLFLASILIFAQVFFEIPPNRFILVSSIFLCTFVPVDSRAVFIFILLFFFLVDVIRRYRTYE